MPTMPLLHAAQAVTHDGPLTVLGLAAAAFAMSALGAYAALWTRGLLLRRRTRRQVLLVVGASLTLLAVLPSIAPIDHIAGLAGHAGEHASVHATHCHDAQASCTDAPVTSASGQMLGADPLIVLPAMLAVMLLVLVAPLSGISSRPELRPPMRAVAAR